MGLLPSFTFWVRMLLLASCELEAQLRNGPKSEVMLLAKEGVVRVASAGTGVASVAQLLLQGVDLYGPPALM